MNSLDDRIHIDAPVDAIWAVLSDITAMGDYMPAFGR